MTLNGKPIVVVTPVFEDREASTLLFEELAAQFGRDVFVVAVDDGSVRQPVSIEQFEQAGIDGTILSLRRNVGHQKAIAIGLAYVAEHIGEEPRVVVMDSDGEDRPDTIRTLLEQLDDPHLDVVVSNRKSRVETLRFKLFYACYKFFFRLITGRAISFGNFMVIKPKGVKRLAAMQEVSVHVASAVLASKLRIGHCPIDRGPRYAGRSKMNFVGLVLHGFRGLMVFAEDVLVRVGVACALIGAVSIAGTLIAVGLKLMGHSTPGWFSVALGILIMIFLQTGALSLVTLMLTGVVRSGSVNVPLAYKDFVKSETHYEVEYA